MKNATLIPVLSISVASAFGLGWALKPTSQVAEGTEVARSQRSVSAGRGRPSRDRASSDESSQFLSRFLKNGTISSENMSEAMREISEMNDPLRRQKLFAALLENLTAENARAAFEALREGQSGGPFGRRNTDQLRLLANAWGRLDGAGAVAAIKEMGEDGRNERGRGRGRGLTTLASVLAGWATVDAAGATAHVNGVTDDREKRGATVGLLQGLLVNGVDDAVQFLEAMPGGAEGERGRGRYMAMVTGEVLEEGLSVAQEWVESVKDAELRSGALTRVALEMMEEDREGAAAWLAEHGDDEAAAFAVSRLAGDWAREDPEAVMDWAAELSGAAKAGAYQEAIDRWAREDVAAAGQYLQTLSDSPERDAAVESFSARVARDDPAAAMEWANSISDVVKRDEAVVEVARHWYETDRTAATQWIEGSGLSKAAREAIKAGPQGPWRGR